MQGRKRNTHSCATDNILPSTQMQENQIYYFLHFPARFSSVWSKRFVQQKGRWSWRTSLQSMASSASCRAESQAVKLSPNPFLYFSLLKDLWFRGKGFLSHWLSKSRNKTFNFASLLSCFWYMFFFHLSKTQCCRGKLLYWRVSRQGSCSTLLWEFTTPPTHRNMFY